MTSQLDNTAENMKDEEIGVVTYDVRRILLPTDGSANSIEAMNVAMGMAKRFGAEVVACFVDPTRVVEPLEEDMIEHSERVHHSSAGLHCAVVSAEKNGVSLKTVVAEAVVREADVPVIVIKHCSTKFCTAVRTDA